MLMLDEIVSSSVNRVAFDCRREALKGCCTLVAAAAGVATAKFCCVTACAASSREPPGEVAGVDTVVLLVAVDTLLTVEGGALCADRDVE